MSLIHIARHGQSLGIFQEEEVRDGIQAKRFFTEDLVWREGMNDWRPLHEVIDTWGLNTAGREADGMTPSAMTEPAWERRSEVGFLKAIFQTVKSVLFHPGTTFSKMNPKGGILAPFIYWILMRMAMLPIAIFYYNKMISFLHHFISHLGPKFAAVNLSFPLTRTIILIFLAPFFCSGIIHLGLKIVGAARHSWRATFRIFCYALGSVSIFAIIPLLGSFLVIFWGCFVFFTGLKKVNECSTGRAIFSMLLSLVLPVLFAAVLILCAVVIIAIVALIAHFLKH